MPTGSDATYRLLEKTTAKKKSRLTNPLPHSQTPLASSSSRVTASRLQKLKREKCQTTPKTHPAECVSPKVLPTASRVALGDLDCVKMLGDGGWAEVYLAQARASGTVFAIKTISKRVFRDTERNDSCLDRRIAAAKKHAERRILCKLPWNPFIVGLLDAYSDSRNTYLLLEYAPGGSVLERVERNNGLSLREAKFYYSNIIIGLEFLHSQGIIHRDIKTDNILIGADGYGMITDFGLSRYIHEPTDWTDHIGTFSYMSPETLNKELDSKESRYALDWWAATVTFFDMLNNGLPFAGRGAIEVSESVKTQTISYNQELPAFLMDFFQNAFNYDLSNRLGALSTPSSKGPMVNAQLRSHPLFKGLRWDRMALRRYPAPFVPDPAPNPCEEIHLRPLPQQRSIPGLQLKRPNSLLEFDEIRGEAEQARKRQHLDTSRSAVYTVRDEAGSRT